ncbi:hypothetical protein [Cohnella silvisoli]|uniref:Uncharacterized protein n=1 Tax=Cohnella silvisoli TaxID=2873699 RepID=A0ABV1KR30_9BACL|nr:hypothetical protein [Cohnella silvisoli]MCD9025553.1 hypothetical protein [Cohnella silvisoli]
MSMHSSVTIPLVPFRERQWEDYLDILRKMKADRALLFAPLDNICRTPVKVKKSIVGDAMLEPLPRQETIDTPSLELYRVWSDLLRERIADLQALDIEPAFWLGHTIGHGGSLSAGGDAAFQQIVGPEGKEAAGCYCPLDKAFAGYIGEALAVMAESGVGLILLDDDFRLHTHKPDASVGCFCPLHLQAFQEKTGIRMEREQLIKQALQGKPNEIRRAWLEVLGESLLGFAQRIEQAVHAVNPAARIGLATGMTLWSNEGVDMLSLLQALAGPTQPFLRTIGAPYWAKEPSQAGWVIELTRLQQSWAGRWGVELAAEGDTFPHTRYHCSSSMLHAYQQGLITAGFPGMIHYPVVYSPPPDHEPGYVALQEESAPYYAALSRFFPADYGDVGVTPVYRPNNFMHVAMPEDIGQSAATWPEEPVALRYLARLGIPVAYEDNEGPVLLSGYGAAGLPDEELERLLDRGAILDATAAIWLAERGIDVGFRSSNAGKAPRFESFSEEIFSGSYTGHLIWLLTSGEGIYRAFDVLEGATVISRFEGNGEDERYPAVFLYENGQGRRFCVMAFDFYQARNGVQLVYNYARQEQLTRCLAWVNRVPVAVTVNGHPDVRVICRKKLGGARLAIGIQNNHLDPIRNPVLRLDPSIVVGESIELLMPETTQARLSSDFEYRNDGTYGYLKIRCSIPSMGLLSVGIQP